ncbi:uncharacterized protein V6R79_002717 [Siganus canaliculatus]
MRRRRTLPCAAFCAHVDLGVVLTPRGRTDSRVWCKVVKCFAVRGLFQSSFQIRPDAAHRFSFLHLFFADYKLRFMQILWTQTTLPVNPPVQVLVLCRSWSCAGPGPLQVLVLCRSQCGGRLRTRNLELRSERHSFVFSCRVRILNVSVDFWCGPRRPLVWMNEATHSHRPPPSSSLSSSSSSSSSHAGAYLSLA